MGADRTIALDMPEKSKEVSLELAISVIIPYTPVIAQPIANGLVAPNRQGCGQTERLSCQATEKRKHLFTEEHHMDAHYLTYWPLELKLVN